VYIYIYIGIERGERERGGERERDKRGMTRWEKRTD